MKDYRKLTDFPKSYQRQFSPAVKELVGKWFKSLENKPSDAAEVAKLCDLWLADMSLDIADRRLGTPDHFTSAGEDKVFRMMDWRTLVEEEAKRRIIESFDTTSF